MLLHSLYCCQCNTLTSLPYSFVASTACCICKRPLFWTFQTLTINQFVFQASEFDTVFSRFFFLVGIHHLRAVHLSINLFQGDAKSKLLRDRLINRYHSHVSLIFIGNLSKKRSGKIPVQGQDIILKYLVYALLLLWY